MILEIKHWFTEDQKAMWELMSSIATTLAAIATFVTVREMRKGRKDMITPDLYIEQKGISVEWKVVKEDPYYFYKKENAFDIYNLGNGPAKDINVMWENNVYERISKSIVEGVDIGESIIVTYGEENFLFDKSDSDYQLNFVLGKEKASTGFYITPTAMKMIELSTLLKANEKKDDIFTFEIDPGENSKLRIEYLDPLGKRNISRFDVKTSVTVIRADDSLQIKKAIFYFSFQKQNNAIFKPKTKSLENR